MAANPAPGSPAYQSALNLLLSRGYTQTDLDNFLIGNPGDIGRVNTAFPAIVPTIGPGGASSIRQSSSVIYGGDSGAAAAFTSAATPTPQATAIPLAASPSDSLVHISSDVAHASVGGAPSTPIMVADAIPPSLSPSTASLPWGLIIVGALVALVVLKKI